MDSVAPPAPRIALPNDLSTSLRYLNDTELQRLLAAVNAEISRRQGTSIRDTSKPSRSPEAHADSGADDIPEGKVNLIRASFAAGLKPATIARTFAVSLSRVNRIIRSDERSKR
jgi:hypothetical protein